MQTQREARLCIYRQMYIVVDAGRTARVERAARIRMRLDGQNSDGKQGEQRERGYAEGTL